jgi:hypothetical protein
MTTQTKHTSGPWHFETAEDWDGATVYDSTSRIVAACDGCDIPGTGGEVSTNEAKANARLIAASPDLLSALIGMMNRYGDKSEHPFCDASISARAAIAKARGEA